MIIDAIKESFPNLADIRARELRIDKPLRKVFCAFSLPNAQKLSVDTKNQISALVQKQLPQGYTCNIRYIDDVFTEVSFRRYLEDLLKRKYPLFASISKNSISIRFNQKNISVTFYVNKVTKENMQVANFEKELTKLFDEYTSYRVEISVELDADATLIGTVKEQERLVQLAINKELFKPARYFRVNNVKTYMGKPIKGAPMYISDVRNAMDTCILCGKISSKTTKASKNNPDMQVCKFTLTDDSQSSISCVSFVKFDLTDIKAIKATTNKSDSEVKTLSDKAKLANEKKMDKLIKLYDETEVLVRGKISFNDFSERLEMVVYDISLCQISPIIKEQAAAERSAPSSYLLLKPEEYREFKQTSFVDNYINKNALQGKQCVLLHVNATGFNVTKDKIIAICGVKLVNGVIVSKLFTYVNPEMAVEDGVLKEAKTSSDDLLFYPTLTEIISDLYKFTYGCELIGLNLAHVLELLNYYAEPTGYKFTNSIADQSDLLSRLFDTSTFEKKPNCSKYVELSKTCKVPCHSYVFCGETAVTIAKCLAVVASKQQ